MLGRLRPFLAKALRAPAQLLLRMGIHPNAVTIFGAVGVIASALIFFPQGGIMLFWGVVACTVFSMTDMLDGTMARLSGKTSRLGAYLDSLLDRVADAAIFGAVVWAFHAEDEATALAALVCMAMGTFVPYARARAEGLGIEAKGGIAERGDRLVIGGIATAAVGLGAPLWILTATFWLLALAAAITVGQRTWMVVRATREDVPVA
jgi:CDP-diacylglycerol--glycerol-3-phosphate 3-phosphatidyltransferase